jgi:hypothetical protein
MNQTGRKPEELPVDFDLSHLEELLSLTPAERLKRHAQALELVQALRRAGIRHYGFDPRPSKETD